MLNYRLNRQIASSSGSPTSLPRRRGAASKAPSDACDETTNITALPRAAIDTILAAHNNTAGKRLGFPTPAETFHPLHFGCESTGA
jgi:hypothetical protein